MLTSEVQAVVDQMLAAEVSFTDLSVAEARALYVDTLAQSGSEPVPMAAVGTHTLSLPGRSVAVRRYRPDGLAAGPAPTVVYYHGGGWVLGDLESHDRVCRQIAARAHCQLIAVDYRLAPEHPLPASSLDAIDAYAHLIGNAVDYGIDPERVAVAGDSAGGHLSAVVAIAARDQAWPLAFQALIYPATDMRGVARHYPSRARNALFPPLTTELMYWFGKRATDENTDIEHWQISPLLADSLEGVAPAQVLTVGADVLMDEGTLYAARLRDALVACDHAHFPGVIHGSIEMFGWLEVTARMLDRVADGIADALSSRR